ncbi:MAG: PorV/PorQ family protein [Flammeovirgaceae bacterium]
MTRFLFLISIYICVCQNVVAQNVPKYVNEFLAIGVGARALGMANTQVAIVDDVTAGYWNPSGLLQNKKKYSASLMHTGWIANTTNYDYAGFSTIIDKRSVLGFSLLRFGVDGIPDTRFLFDADGRLNYNNVTSFSSADYAFIFSYARRFPLLKDIRFGANAKIIHRKAGTFANAWGFGVDVGAQYNQERWYFGVNARDITSTFNVWSVNSQALYETFSITDNTIPENSIEIALPRLITDVAYKIPILISENNLNNNTNNNSVTHVEKLGLWISASLETTFDGKRNTVLKTNFASIDPKIGLELHYKNLVFIRSGINGIQKIKQLGGGEKYNLNPNFGLGFKISDLQIDYALTSLGEFNAKLYSHVFSLKAGFDVSKNKTPRHIY